MSLNDFDTIPDPDDKIISKIGPTVRLAMAAKETLNDAIASAIETSTDFGYALGAADERDKLVDALENEKIALQELDMNEQYISGVIHAIALLKATK
jgi:hypothetical protein